MCHGMQISYMWCVAAPCQGQSSLVSANTGRGSMAMQTQWNTNKEMREKWRLVFGRNTGRGAPAHDHPSVNVNVIVDVPETCQIHLPLGNFNFNSSMTASNSPQPTLYFAVAMTRPPSRTTPDTASQHPPC